MALSPVKAKKMLREGEAHGQSLTKRQRGFFGLVASGQRPREMAQKLKSKKRR